MSWRSFPPGGSSCQTKPPHSSGPSGCSVATPPSVSVLSVKGDLDALYLVTQFDGGTELQVHTLLDCRQSQQQQRLAIDVLRRQRHKQMFRPFTSLHPQSFINSTDGENASCCSELYSGSLLYVWGKKNTRAQASSKNTVSRGASWTWPMFLCSALCWPIVGVFHLFMCTFS